MSGKSLSDRYDDLEVRMRAVERFQAILVGAGFAFGTLFGVVVPFLLSKL